MNIFSWIIIGLATNISRRLFIRETKKLAKKLNMPVWKVQALIIAGIIVCVGGVWYVYTKGFDNGFSSGAEKATKEAAEKMAREAQESFRKGFDKGKWSSVYDIATLNPDSEFIQYLNEVGVIVKDKFDNYESFSKSYNREYWGFGGEWD